MEGQSVYHHVGSRPQDRRTRPRRAPPTRGALLRMMSLRRPNVDPACIWGVGSLRIASYLSLTRYQPSGSPATDRIEAYPGD